MHTPIKYALGLLAIVALSATPMSTAADSDDLLRAVAHHHVGEAQILAVDAGVANACDDADLGTTATLAAHDAAAIVFGDNSFPSSWVRAGDQGVFGSCIAIFAGTYCDETLLPVPPTFSISGDPATNTAPVPSPDCAYAGEYGGHYRIVMNGIVPDGELTNDDCSDDYPAYSTAVCGLYSHHADVLGGYACFYDATLTLISCSTEYDPYGHDLIGVVPDLSAYMLIGSTVDTFEVTSWFGCDDVYYTLQYGGDLCADPDSYWITL
jgi:hypothetical protein